ncbi:hypothetical protein H4R20_006122 [Coemansia guatemalensis]|uniref:DUF7707 domain-containing protein n=1 Tax=Coemansia guatemalensis TaxID=2761395 RepID=A0A9W8HND3_9FUNG|nr:hypothetical protein H4R20_006122 [Coemansia guatemalensis]
MPEKIRKELCAEQVLFCTNVCGGEGFTREAFCNTNTLGSKCACSNGAEVAIRRYQWPVFQRVCEAQRSECKLGCDRGNVANGDKSACFNSCDSRMACGSEHAPDLKMMVDKYDDPTTSSPKLEIKTKANSTSTADSSSSGGKDTGSQQKPESRIKGKKDSKGGPPKRRGGPLPTGSSSGAAEVISSGAWPAVVSAAIAVAIGSNFF